MEPKKEDVFVLTPPEPERVKPEPTPNKAPAESAAQRSFIRTTFDRKVEVIST